jgi:hypothetical protein
MILQEDVEVTSNFNMLLSLNVFFWTNFVEFLTKNCKIFGKHCFSSMSLTNFAILGENFVKLLIPQN